MSRPRLARTAGALLLLVVLAGCANAPVQPAGVDRNTTAGGSSSGAPSSSARSSRGPSSSAPSDTGSAAPTATPSGGVPRGTAGVSPERIDVTGAPRTAPTGAWLAGNGHTLYVTAAEAACTLLHASVLDQRGGAVRVALSSDKLRTFAACPKRVVRKTARVDLAAPLGDRRLVFVDAG